MIVCTLFAGVRPTPCDVWRGDWETFVGDRLPSLLETRVPCPADPTPKQKVDAKKKCPGFVLAEVEGRRTDDTVGAHTALVIDVDALPDNDLGALLKRASKYRCAVYETPSSTDEAPRVRVIVALDEPLEPEGVIAARLAFAEALGLDPATCGTAGAKPPSQVMFAGRLKGTRQRGLWAYEGRKIFTPPAVLEIRRPAKRTRTTSSETAPTCDRGEFPFDSPPDLASIAKYVPPAGLDGDRHALVRGLGGWLARRGYAVRAIAEAVSEQIPSSDPAERAAQATDAAERVRRGEEAPGWDALSGWAQTYAKGASTLRRLERACRDPREPSTFSGSGTGDVWSEWWAGVFARWDARPVAVTDGESTVDVVRGELDSTGLHLHPTTGWPWILQRDGSYWLHSVSAHTYNPEVRSGELEASVARDLAGLVSEEDRTPTALRSGWIKPLRGLRATYTARTHTYDHNTRTLTLAALRWTTRPAKFHKAIDRWLRALFGDGYGAAAQWLASLVVLERPAPCMYMAGPKGLGKTLLADGLAALWQCPAPVDMAEAIDSFNEATAECPLVFTDEGFPEGLNFNTLRKMVTQHSRRVNVKYKAKYAIEGAGRYMIAANNEDVLRYQKIGTLTADDLDAIADRLLVLLCQVEARAVLDSHTVEELTAWAQGEIAEHVLHLAQTVALEPAGRMAARPGGGERILASVVAGRSSEVLQRVRESIGTGSMGEKSGVHVPKGIGASGAVPEVWINVPRLAATFDGRITLAAVKECCSAFALRPDPEQHKVGGDNLMWRVLSRLRLDEAFVKLD